MSMAEYREELIDAVIEQMRRDLEVGDASAIYELLSNHVPIKSLESFLPEELSNELEGKWKIRG